MLARFIILICALKTSLQISTPADSSYVAAVVEYAFTNNSTVNLENYLQYIQNASSQSADIIVFPELTLTRGHPIEIPINGSLRQYPVPANATTLYDPVLVSLSEAAIANQIYIVVNLEEIMNCTLPNTAATENCPEEKAYLFNTDVVFDRNGAIIDRYRKINLFGEYSRTAALEPDLGFFTTDFGVTFGHFVCFDLMFQIPAIQVVEKYNITDVIFPTMWFSELPYLTAVQIQEAYAYTLNVNFLAAGANNPVVGSAGSGIYSGKAGALVSTMPGAQKSRLLVARVPKQPGAVNVTVPGPIIDPAGEADTLNLKRDPSIPAHVSRLLVNGFQEFVLSHNDVTCKFRVRLNRRSGDVGLQYRAVIHDGVNTYVKRQIGVVSCAVMACTTNDAGTCPQTKLNTNDTSAVFEELSVKMHTYKIQFNNTLKCDNNVYFPSTMQNNKFPLSPKNYTFAEKIQYGDEQNQDGGRETITMSLKEPQNSLVVFGVWGRIYTRDVDHNVAANEEDIDAYNEIEKYIFDSQQQSLIDG